MYNYLSTEIADKLGSIKLNKEELPKEVFNYAVASYTSSLTKLREELLSADLPPSNAYEKALKWSRDGETVELYRGQRVNCDIYRTTSWTLQPSLAYSFAFKETDSEIKVMRIPLSTLNDISLYALDFGSEVIMNTRCELYQHLYEESETITIEEAMSRNYDYIDKRYDCIFGEVPMPYLSRWNTYPFSLVYPPYKG